MSMVDVRRWDDRFRADETRVITRFFWPGSWHKILRILQRVTAMPEEQVHDLLQQVHEDFAKRHKHVQDVFSRHFALALNRFRAQCEDCNDKGVIALLDDLQDPDLPEQRRLLIGAYFTNEYSAEAAAFFNPSIVPHFDQSGLPDGALRIILSFRAVGEGHISSIVFRTGVLENSDIHWDPVSRFAETPILLENPHYDKKLFTIKLQELGAVDETSQEILDQLDDEFTLMQLRRLLRQYRKDESPTSGSKSVQTVQWLAESNYEIHFEDHHDLTERVLFPVSRVEKQGLEDARFVRFVDDDGRATYYATYTAWDGETIMPQMIETADFLHYRVITLNGPAAKGKGMALFPRLINGRYAMIGRQDGENMFYMSSDNIHFWYDYELLQEPKEPWEYVQIGNCGSPIETDKGWLLLTHGVGPMRRYAIGAMLLDLDDPRKVIGRLRRPLLEPTDAEREGYVPNVVYSCGALIHQGELVLPYAVSDSVSGIAALHMDDILDSLIRQGP